MEFTSEEEIALIKRQLLRRSIGVMEGCNRASNVGEVRRVNIVYYLSVNGTIQHPHLIRVRIQHNGVRLRDVKRWLSDLRGKDMPDSFSWSYKRQYKIGYVWQDLMDDDLITPICDNEYVLMGSQLPSSSPYPFSIIDTSSCGEKTPSHDLNFVPSTESDQKHPTKTPPPPLVGPHQVETDEEATRKSQSPEDGRRSSVEAPRSVSPQNEEPFVEDGRSKGSRRASRGVRAILACGMVECNGTPLLSVRRRGRGHHGIITRILPLCFRRTGSL